jgi:hypothetical protein
MADKSEARNQKSERRTRCRSVECAVLITKRLRYYAGLLPEACDDLNMARKSEARNQKSEAWPAAPKHSRTHESLWNEKKRSHFERCCARDGGAPMTRVRKPLMVIGHWSFSGARCLEFGVSVCEPGPDPVSRWSKPGFSPGLTGFGRVCPGLTGYSFDEARLATEGISVDHTTRYMGLAFHTRALVNIPRPDPVPGI